MKMIQKHPKALFAWIAIWALVIPIVWNEGTFDSVALALLSNIPLMYIEPIQRKKSSWIVEIVILLAIFAGAYFLVHSSFWEELRHERWFALFFIGFVFAGGAYRLIRWWSYYESYKPSRIEILMEKKKKGRTS